MLNTTLGKVILSGTLLLAGGGFLVYSSLDDAQYYRMADEVAANPGKWVDKDLKVHGYVLAGSVDTDQRTFTLEKNGARIHVHFTGPRPDNLKDRAEIVAQGRLRTDPDGTLRFTAAELTAKCPSKYQGAASNRDVF